MSLKSKNFSWWMLPVAILLLLIGVWMGRMGGDNQASPAASEDAAQDIQNSDAVVMSVEGIYPSAAMIDEVLNASGSIAAKEVASVGARMNGVAIERVLVDVGDYVNAGQVLAILDARMVQQDVVAAEAELKQALASLDKANADLARVQPLMAIDAISREQYDAYKTAKLHAEATLSAVRARLNNVHAQRGHAQVIAPVSGIVSARQAEVGMVTSGATLFEIIKNGSLEWQATVRAQDAGRIVVGQMAQIDTPAGTAQAQVTRIAPVANSSRDLVVHTEIVDDVGLRSGMYQSGRFIFAQASALMLPQRAIMNSDGYDYVWRLMKVEGDIYQVARQKVTLGKRSGDRVAVDVAADTLVVAQSGSFLSDGDRVRLVVVDPTNTAAAKVNEAFLSPEADGVPAVVTK